MARALDRCRPNETESGSGLEGEPIRRGDFCCASGTAFLRPPEARYARSCAILLVDLYPERRNRALPLLVVVE